MSHAVVSGVVRLLSDEQHKRIQAKQVKF